MKRGTKRRPPVHPGRILKGEMEEIGMTANTIALALRIPANRLTEIANGPVRSLPTLLCAWLDSSERRPNSG